MLDRAVTVLAMAKPAMAASNSGRRRTPWADRALGLVLAAVAGAANAGGFVAVHQYTSHMTGFASQLADGLVLGNGKLLLNALGAMRDLDVAALESLPQWADAYIGGTDEAARERAQEWQTMEAAVTAERRIRRAGLLAALGATGTGQALLGLERWLHALPQAAWTPELAERSIGDWAASRTKRLHARLAAEIEEMEAADLDTEEGIEHQHNVRLLAKRTRYVLEALRTVLPKERTRRWQEQATELQTSIGAARDLMLLATLLEPLGVHAGILGFLRGVAAGRMAGD